MCWRWETSKIIRIAALGGNASPTVRTRTPSFTGKCHIMIMNKICAIFSDQKINKSVHHTTILWPFSQMWITLHFVNRCVRVCVHVLRALICIYPNSIKCDMDKLIFIVPVTVTIKLFSILFSPTYSLCSNPLLPWLSSYGFMVELIKWYSRLYCILKNLHKTTVFHHIFSTNKSLSVHHQMWFFFCDGPLQVGFRRVFEDMSSFIWAGFISCAI